MRGNRFWMSGSWCEHTGENASGKNATTTFFLPRYSDSETGWPPGPRSLNSGAVCPTSRVAIWGPPSGPRGAGFFGPAAAPSPRPSGLGPLARRGGRALLHAPAARDAHHILAGARQVRERARPLLA